MSRFLLVAPPLVGHVLPLSAVARELEARGHNVAWVVHERHVEHLLPQGADVYGLDDDRVGKLHELHGARLEAGARHATLTVFDDYFCPLARETLADVERAVADFGPDALVVDEHAYAGGFAARRAQLPWATSAPTVQVLIDLTAPSQVRRFIDDRLAALQRDCELEPVESPGRSPHGVVLYTTRPFVGELPLPDEFVLVGPVTSGIPDDLPFPWERLRRRPRILVTLGTVISAARRNIYEKAIEAFGGTDVELVLVAPPNVAPATPPENVTVAAWAPHDRLMPQVDAVVCHAGVNTVHEALRHDLPLVMAPAAYDQGFAARAVARSGAGIVVRSRRLTAAELRTAVETVLREPSYRRAAAELGASFRASPGAAGAAAFLEGLAVSTVSR